MKNTKRYLSIFLALALSAPLFTGCDNGLDEYPSDASVPAPSDKFTTTVQFVSSLRDASLNWNDAPLADYLVHTLGDKNPWLTVLDRADGGNQLAATKAAWDSERWMTFAFNKMANKVGQGSMLYTGCWATPDTYISCASGVPSGKGCYVTEVKTKLNGMRTDKTDTGDVTGTTEVSFDVHFLTARFDTADQIAAFGGESGVLRSFYDKTMPLLMIGTVRGDLFATLESAAQSASGSYAFKVFRVADGSQYTIFMLTEERFWGLNGVEKTPLTGGGDAEVYDIRVMW